MATCSNRLASIDWTVLDTLFWRAGILQTSTQKIDLNNNLNSCATDKLTLVHLLEQPRSSLQHPVSQLLGRCISMSNIVIAFVCLTPVWFACGFNSACSVT